MPVYNGLSLYILSAAHSIGTLIYALIFINHEDHACALARRGSSRER